MAVAMAVGMAVAIGGGREVVTVEVVTGAERAAVAMAVAMAVVTEVVTVEVVTGAVKVAVMVVVATVVRGGGGWRRRTRGWRWGRW